MINQISIKLNEYKNIFELKVPFIMNNFVRQLPNCRFRRRDKLWTMHPSRRGALMIQEKQEFFKFGEGVKEKLIEQIALGNPKKGPPFPVNFPFKTAPFKHQLTCCEKMWPIEHGAIFGETGTGKTKMSIDITAARFLASQIHGLLVICPTPIKFNWAKDELDVHCAVPFEVQVVANKTKTKDRELTEFCTEGPKQGVLKVLIIGTESLSQGEKKGRAWEYGISFLTYMKKTQIVLDEGHFIKNIQSTRSKNVIALGQYAKYRLIMTGTPVLQGPMDLYSQYEFADTNIMGFGDFYAFRNRYAIMGGFENREIVAYDNTEELVKTIEPWTYQITKAEALDLPDKVYQRRVVPMSAEIRKIYKKIKKDRTFISEEQDIELICENILTLNLALQQLVAGMVSFKREGDLERTVREVIPADQNPKIKEMLNILESIPADAQVIIWARFKHELYQLIDVLEKTYPDAGVARYHGDLNQDEREIERNMFKAGEKRFFVSNQQTGGTGLTLNEATYTIYISNTFNLAHRLQSEDRNHRIGQHNKVTYFDIVMEKTVDETIMEAIESKMDLADYIKSKIKEMGAEKFIEEKC